MQGQHFPVAGPCHVPCGGRDATKGKEEEGGVCPGLGFQLGKGSSLEMFTV